MKKTTLVFVGLFIVALTIGVIAAIRISRNNQAKNTSTNIVQGDVTATPGSSVVIWNDPAGFTFKYYDGVIINKHDEDKENYAHIEMTHPMHPGRLTVWANDTTASDVTAWVRTEPRLKNGGSIDTTLGGKEAKKTSIPGDVPRLFVSAIDEAIVFYIDVELVDDAYWRNQFGAIVDSFMFTPLAGDTIVKQAVVSTESYDEEEVVE